MSNGSRWSQPTSPEMVTRRKTREKRLSSALGIFVEEPLNHGYFGRQLRYGMKGEEGSLHWPFG